MKKKGIVIGIILATIVGGFAIHKKINIKANNNVVASKSIDLNDAKLDSNSKKLATEIEKIVETNKLKVLNTTSEVYLEFSKSEGNGIEFESDLTFPVEGEDMPTVFSAEIEYKGKEGEKPVIDLNQGFISEVTNAIVGAKVDLTKINNEVNDWLNKNYPSTVAKKLRANIEVGKTTIQIQERSSGGFFYSVIKN